VTTIRVFVEQAYPDASTTHDWVPEYGDDNIECAECAVRPYNHDARIDCVDLIRKIVGSFPVFDTDDPPF